MGSPVVPADSASSVNPVNVLVPAVIPSPIKGCPFEYDNGSVCLDLKLFGRGYCTKHYQQLRRAGAFAVKGQADTLDVIGEVERVRMDKALSILQRASPHLARLVVKASKVAANRGDIKPAAWGLLHSRAVEPVSKDGPSQQSSAPIINIGFALAGVKPTVETIDSE